MTEFLLSAAILVLVVVGLGLARVLRGPGDADRLMAAQLVGTGGVAVLLLFGVASGTPGVLDLALVMVLLAAFAAVAFVMGVERGRQSPARSGDGDAGPAQSDTPA
jgi:multicomponent Na+:H+ antiporter subunit F